MYPTHLLEKISKEKEKAREEKRLQVLNQAVPIIKEYFLGLSVSAVFLTGSLIEPLRFHNHSDIDIAVRGLDEALYFKCISDLEERLGRVVEIIELEKCSFSDKIIKTGFQIF